LPFGSSAISAANTIGHTPIRLNNAKNERFTPSSWPVIIFTMSSPA
jgi:hypothetical protein